MLDKLEEMTKDEYYARHVEGEREAKRAARERAKDAANSERSSTARDLILNAVRAQPGISQRVLLEKTVGKDVGSKALLDMRDALVEEGVIRTEEGARKATLHHIAEPAEEGPK